jgi:hypothetical protein
MNIKLLKIEDIARLYDCSRNTARDMKVKTVGFPSRVPGSSERKPRWLESAVNAFLLGK